MNNIDALQRMLENSMRIQAAPAASVAAAMESASIQADQLASKAATKGRTVQYTHWSKCMDRHIKFHRRREEQVLASRQIKDRGEAEMDPMRRTATSGDQKLELLEWWLNNMGVERSPDQRLFHRYFINTMLAKIYGPAEWNEVGLRVLKERGLDELRTEVLATTPRRWGKTWAVALFVLALMLACPGIRVCVFSTGKRASSSLMEIMMQFMNNVPSLQQRIVKQNQEELYISGQAIEEGLSKSSAAARAAHMDKLTSKLFCYPCSVTGQFISFFFPSATPSCPFLPFT
jgi:hypothetical protein